MQTTDIFDKGFAIFLYNIDRDVQTFRFREEEKRVKAGAVTTSVMNGLRVALWLEVMGAPEA